MERHINTYGGLNKDTAYDSLEAGLYIDALDIRISTTTGESMGAWTNIKGNKQMFTIPLTNAQVPGGNNFGSWSTVNPEIIGYTTIRNRIIVFVADDSNSKGWIYDVQYNTATRDILSGFPRLIYYNANLNFKKEWPIEALGRYETDCVQRVYWTDYNNYFRTINIEDSGLTTLPIGLVDVFPDITYTQPLLTLIGSGSLLTGSYQVSYRLKTVDGKETLIAPPGNLIHVVSDSETVTQSAQYNGDLSAVNSGKALQIEINTSNYLNFDSIELIVAYYENLNAIPVVLSVETQTIANNSKIIFVYSGNEGETFPIEVFDFILKNYPFKTPKTITQKDSSLIISNIKGSSINVQDLLAPSETFDARTARYLNNGTSLPFPLTGTPEQIEEKKLKNAFNSSVDATVYPTRPTIGFNHDAHWDDDWQNNKQFKYKSDGITLGGEGPNISYKFWLEPFTLDGNNPSAAFANISNIPDFVFTHNFNDGYGNYPNTTFPNNASPFISGLLRGYKRGETYRFGIIFYTKKGEATFVEYIGDIKFPDISEPDGTNNTSLTNYWPIALIGSRVPGAGNPNDTIGFSMGIEFTIDLSSCPSLLNNITSYQIVRLKREDIDKRRYTQGFVKGFYYAPITSPGYNFDLRGPGNDERVLHLYPIYPMSTALNAGRANASFGTLQDQQFDPAPYTPKYADYLIKGAHLAFYCPELSFDFGTSRSVLSSTSSSPCLLITGAYRYDYRGVPLPVKDLSSDGLGQYCQDYRVTFKDTNFVSFNSKENIKKWDNISLQVMPNYSDYKEKITPSMFNSFYMRNYYALDNYPKKLDPGVPPTLNNPQQGIGNSDAPQLYKAGTSIIGNVIKISTDLYTQQSITSSAYDWFRAPALVGPLTGEPALQFPIVDYLIPRIETYGGYTTSALTSNVFIPASPVISTSNLVGNTHTFRVFGGDVFITMFTAQTGLVEFNTDFYSGNNTYRQDNSTTDVYPIESVMNLELASGSTLRTGVTFQYNSQILEILRQETNNIIGTYAKNTLMYKYNEVFSKENDNVVFTVEPVNAKDCKVNDLRGYLSNVKVNDETIDSWTKYGINNFYDIDDYGPINKILNYKDTVYFFQDRGFGAYAINRAAITTTADGVPTQLGTGLGFGKHQYISKAHGSIHQWGIKATDTAIYFFDAINRKFFMFASSGTNMSTTPLSEIKGIHSWLQTLPDAIFYRKLDSSKGDNPILKKGITIGRDVINDEIIFTFLGSAVAIPLAIASLYNPGTIVTVNNLYYKVHTTFVSSLDITTALNQLILNSTLLTGESSLDKSIVYDELMQKFSSRYSATPKMWLENSDTLLSTDINNNTNIFVHNIGNWGEFYGVKQEAFITLVINPNADLNKILRTLEYNSIVRDDNKIIDRTQTITAFEITTQYQSTGKVPYNSGRIMRKFDKWRVKIPRNQLSVSKQDRLRSTYFVLTLYFDNLNNKEIICNRLMSYYDVQIF